MQVVFEDDPQLRDSYWKDWVVKLRQPVASVAPEGDGVVARITVPID